MEKGNRRKSVLEGLSSSSGLETREFEHIETALKCGAFFGLVILGMQRTGAWTQTCSA